MVPKLFPFYSNNIVRKVLFDCDWPILVLFIPSHSVAVSTHSAIFCNRRTVKLVSKNCKKEKLCGNTNGVSADQHGEYLLLSVKSGGKFSVFTTTYINPALSQSGFRIDKCSIRRRFNTSG